MPHRNSFRFANPGNPSNTPRSTDSADLQKINVPQQYFIPEPVSRIQNIGISPSHLPIEKYNFNIPVMMSSTLGPKLSLASPSLSPSPDDPWNSPMILTDGSKLEIRMIKPADHDRLNDFHESLSDKTIFYRFHHSYPHLTEHQINYFTRVDGVKRVAFVAISKEDEIVAVARYDVDNSDATRAEYAIVVRDSWQGHGLGKMLMRRLIKHSWAHGIREVYGSILCENRAMERLMIKLGEECSGKVEIRSEDEEDMIVLKKE
ncbi:Acetate--CoA ligase [ADP-forming] II subunit alpha [Nowakowskiella sp. JEL0078]|nr:Acetate--CoA ligase [ADP-forming] II subunit alpha [Nowakowskiella sp. JEL0078]